MDKEAHEKDPHAGSITVEFALGLIAVMSVLGMIFAGMGAAHAKTQACQLARDAARSAMLGSGAGGPPATEDSFVEEGVWGNVTFERNGQWVHVSAQWPLPTPVAWIAPEMSCEMRTLVEEGGDG